MNRCTQLDDMLQSHVSWRPDEPYFISRSFFR